MSERSMAEFVGEDVLKGSIFEGPPAEAQQRLLDLPEVDERKIPERERPLIEGYQQALAQLFDTSAHAKFKIEFTVSGDTIHTNNPTWRGMLTFWECGRAKADAGLDKRIYLCPGKLKRRNNCYRAIPYHANQGGRLICGYCGSVWKDEDVIGETLGNLTVNNWAKTIARHISERFENSVDLVVRSTVPKLREVTESEQQKAQHGERLHKLAKKGRQFIYLHERMAQDLRSGSLLEDRIRVFLKSI